MIRRRQTGDLIVSGLGLAVSLFLILIGVASWGEWSVYFVALGAAGGVCFVPIAVDAYRCRPISRAHRVFVAVSAFVLGVFTGSVVLLPIMFLVTLWFAVTAAFATPAMRP